MRTHLCALAVSRVLVVLAPSAAVAQLQCSNTFEPITAQEWNDGANPGWNIGNTLDATPDETSWGQPRVVNSTITNVKSAGFRGIRIPITHQDHFISGAPDYILDPAWLDRIVEVLSYVTSQGLYALVNSHHDSWWLDPSNTALTADEKEEKYYRMWYQVASRLACQSSKVAFEPLNEPSGQGEDGAGFLLRLHGAFYRAIADAGGHNSKRVLVVGPLGNSWPNMVQYPGYPPDVENPVILSYHFYGPWDFTATAWGRTWWGNDEDKANMESEIAQVRGNFTETPLHIGEMGVGPPSTETAARWKWHDFLCRTAHKYNTSSFLWDAGGSFADDTPWWTWRDLDPTTIRIINTASQGIPNALPDSTTDNQASEAWTSAYLFHHQNETLGDKRLPFLWNGNTLLNVEVTRACNGSQPVTLVEGRDWEVDGNDLVVKEAFVSSVFPRGSSLGKKGSLLLQFDQGADLTLEIFHWAASELGFDSFEVTRENMGQDLWIPIKWNGLNRVATVEAYKSDGVPLRDEWTIWMGPLQRGRLVNGNYQVELTENRVAIRAEILQSVFNAGLTTNFRFEFHPRQPDVNFANFTITVA
ncbi:hypothetical protein S40293_01290 [Stachybotrys chartarum IBT 40293]|nr:hypothetical protein S40293_01290 [Stachybotrys chartarum IBT 40293]